MKSLKRSFAGQHVQDSISSKVFIRSTRNGRVQKVVREQYLRKDIPCSSRLCPECTSTAAADANGNGKLIALGFRKYLTNVVPKPVLSRQPLRTKSFPNGHYILPDTNVLLSGMDLFEQGDAFFDVIVLQTVLEELRNRSLPLYNRLLALTKSEDKRFYLFFNEFRTETSVQREEGESINDRNDRAVRKAAKWYAQHLSQKVKKDVPTIVMITNDADNRKKAKKESTESLSLRDYVSGLENAERLLDMVAEGRKDQVTPGELLYPDYLTMSKMTSGIKAGVLHQGIFHVSPYNYLEGTVKVPGFDKPLLVLGRGSSNRSVSGDVVVVELLPTAQWKQPSTRILEEETVTRNDDAENEDDQAPVVTESEKKALQEQAKKAQQGGPDKAQPTARVVGVMKRSWRQYVGTVDPGSATAGGQRQRNVFFIPMDKRIPKIRIKSRQVEELVGKRVVATIDTWEPDSRYPAGHFLRSLGELETKDAETEALLLEYDVQYRPFPKAVLDCLPSEGHDWKVPQDMSHPGWKGRQDLRDRLICSIDPPGCQDIDDALHAKLLPNGNFEVGVHIADVSHFVRPNNPMDAEATARGTTVYLVDKRIDMLPMLLGTDLCSLKPYVERYAFSTLWEMMPDAEVVSASFTKSVIYSREGFSYEQAQKRIDDRAAQDELTEGMRTLLMLSKRLRQKRMDAGALNLSSPEVRIEADTDETSDALADIKTKAHLETNSLVEEFMLLANITVAQKIQTVFPQTALLRRHATPPASNFTELGEQLKRMRGFELDVSSSRALADSLDLCVDPAHPFFNTLIRILATRCMTSAEYFCSGSHAEPEYRHYGLASEIYTHFTSPIRRYADLLVHRQLAYAIGFDGQGSEIVDEGLRNKIKLEAVCRNLNFRHRNAQHAGRASIEYYVGQALKARGQKAPDSKIDVDGYVMRVFDNGIVVFVPQFGVEGLVRLEDFQLCATQAQDDEINGAETSRESQFDADAYRLKVFDKGHEQQPQQQQQEGRSIVVELFQQLKVRVSSEEKGGSREKGKRRVRIVVLPVTPPT